MKLELIDFLIILAYILTIVAIGFIMKRRAQKNKGEYLLGGNTLPWYMLGLSNASGMFDISGTMWLIAIGFIYGLKSIWIPWIWPVFNQIFLMMYLSIWLRRSNVTTGAEWIATRFGTGREGRRSHNIVVIYALIGCLGFLAYGFIGLGKFIMLFIPWEGFLAPMLGIAPGVVPPEYVPHIYGIIFTLIATLYAILGGMVSIVWADVVQYLIMTVSAVVVGVVAMNALGDTSITQYVPESWTSPFFGWNLDLDWSGTLEAANAKIASDGYTIFGAFFMMMIFKGILVSAAGPAPNYDMQKILATKSPSDAAKMSGSVSVVLMPFRYLMIAGFTVLALLYFDKLNLTIGERVDFEQILPSAMADLKELFPVGVMGLLLAGLLAAFMSTFAGTLNAAQAYVVNDIYLKYIKPDASNKQVSNANYIVGIITVLVSIVFGVFAKDVNSILQWIVSALWGSYVASNVLKWHWWRFNGNGYFWGMVAGIIPAMVFPMIFHSTLELYYFPLILLISILGCIAGTYSSKPTDENVLKDFYKNVRPWGFWEPIKQKVKAEDPSFEENKFFYKDMFNVAIGIIAQTALVALPIYLVIKEITPMIITIIITVICFIILKKTWWNSLKYRDH